MPILKLISQGNAKTSAGIFYKAFKRQMIKQAEIKRKQFLAKFILKT